MLLVRCWRLFSLGLIRARTSDMMFVRCRVPVRRLLARPSAILGSLQALYSAACSWILSVVSILNFLNKGCEGK